MTRIAVRETIRVQFALFSPSVGIGEVQWQSVWCSPVLNPIHKRSPYSNGLAAVTTRAVAKARHGEKAVEVVGVRALLQDSIVVMNRLFVWNQTISLQRARASYGVRETEYGRGVWLTVPW